MLVVADSSPLILLIHIGHIDVLPRLFRQVVIPAEVSAELLQSNRPRAVHNFMASHPAWLLAGNWGQGELGSGGIGVRA